MEIILLILWFTFVHIYCWHLAIGKKQAQRRIEKQKVVAFSPPFVPVLRSRRNDNAREAIHFATYHRMDERTCPIKFTCPGEPCTGGLELKSPFVM